MSAQQLQGSLAWAPKSSLRAAQRRLVDLGALVEAGPAGSSRSAVFEPTVAGRELLALADSLERWIGGGPAGPLPLDALAAQGIVRALAAAWESTVVRTLAERPRTLAQLDGCISGVAYPSLKRRLDKLLSIGLIGREDAESGYDASEWLRRAAQPLILAVRWERRHDKDADPLTASEVEAVFLLILPLVELPGRASGACTLSVLLSSDGHRSARGVAAVSVEGGKGRTALSAAGAAEEPETWALGDVDSWLAAILEGDASGLRVRGAKPKLAQRTVAGLHRALFAA